MIKIGYVFHDCFFLESESCNILFDYWKEPEGNSFRFLEHADEEKPLLVFISHFHKDHFNPEVFSLKGKFANVHYFFGNDVRKRIRHVLSETSCFNGTKLETGEYSVLKPGDSVKFQAGNASVEISAYDSTDVGLSWLIRIDGHSIFHAGDLNAWSWIEESTEAQVAEARKAFTDILETMSFGEIDIAFFPVDPRLGREFSWGAEMFMRKFRINNFFAMHYELAKDVGQQKLFYSMVSEFSKYALSHCEFYYCLRSGSFVGLRK